MIGSFQTGNKERGGKGREDNGSREKNWLPYPKVELKWQLSEGKSDADSFH